MIADCHALFNCVIKLNESGKRIAPYRGSGAPHMNFYSHDFFVWANLLKVNCLPIALQREWRPSGDELVVFERLGDSATTSPVAPPSSTTSPWASICLGV